MSALTVGLILFTVVGSISGQVRDMSDMMYSYQTHSVTADYQSARIRQPVGGTEEYRTFYPAPIDSRKAQEITERLEEFDGDDVYGMGQEYDMYDAALRREQLTAEFVEACGLAEEDDLIFDAEIIVLDDEHYKKLCETHDIPLGSAILLNHISINENGHATDYVPFTSQSFHWKKKTAASSRTISAGYYIRRIFLKSFFIRTPIRSASSWKARWFADTAGCIPLRMKRGT